MHAHVQHLKQISNLGAESESRTLTCVERKLKHRLVIPKLVQSEVKAVIERQKCCFACCGIRSACAHGERTIRVLESNSSSTSCSTLEIKSMPVATYDSIVSDITRAQSVVDCCGDAVHQMTPDIPSPALPTD